MAAAADLRTEQLTREALGRVDYAIIGEIIAPGSKVLDLGCGDGELLAWLKRRKRVEARGVEISGEMVRRAISRGVPVYQGDIEEALADYPDAIFDYVILSQTLQEARAPLKILREMLRVGKRAVVAFPNFGHWRVRVAHLWTGRAPQTKLFPYEWYDSPNIHFLTIIDFEMLVEKEGFRIDRRFFLADGRRVSVAPNLMAEAAVYEISGAAGDSARHS